jgi:hypothetical protein
MTPAQSLAFLALVIFAVLCVVWLIAEHHRTILKHQTTFVEGTPVHESTVEESKLRPALDLFEGSTEASQGPHEVYDWAVQGI